MELADCMIAGAKEVQLCAGAAAEARGIPKEPPFSLHFIFECLTRPVSPS